LKKTRAGQDIKVEDTLLADEERVTSPARISATLADIHRHLVPLGVRLEPDGALYNSLLARLDAIQKRLYLDRLTPDEDRAKLCPGQKIGVYANLRGHAIRFSTSVDEVLLDAESRLYLVRYPSEISDLRRRDVFRVHLPLSQRRHVRLQRKESNTEFSAQIVDLSVKGFCLELNEADIDQEQLGSRFEYSGMELPDRRITLSGEAVLVNLRPSARPGALSAGFAIANLDPQTEQSLMRASLYYQREARRLRA
jgi:c-di-GMP-binding flagellar brake protein YcgR